jgi:hypothetical protein
MFEKVGGYHILPNIPNISLVDINSQYKYAQADDEIVEFLGRYRALHDHFYVRIINVAAGEYWGANNNADFFPEEHLMVNHPNYGYRTFQLYAKIYRHHANKNPEAAYGNIPIAVYNRRMHYVESVLELPMDRNGDIYRQLEKGQFPKTSMGTKVPYDICTICGRKASSQADRCIHILQEKKKIYPDGKMVAMINHYPRFFDQSIVVIPADSIALGLERVYPKGGETMNIKAAEDYSDCLQKVASLGVDKAADFAKRVESFITDSRPGLETFTTEIRNKLQAGEKPFTKQDLEIMSEHTPQSVFDTLTTLGVIPTIKEASDILTVTEDNVDHITAEQELASEPTLVNKLAHLCPNRSWALPYLAPRLAKIASEPARKEHPYEKIEQAKLNALAAGLLSFPAIMMGMSEATMSVKGIPPITATLKLTKSGLAGALASLGVALLAYKAGEIGNLVARKNYEEEKTSGMKALVATVPAAWFASEYMKSKRDMGYDVGGVGNFVAEHPFITAGLATAGVHRAGEYLTQHSSPSLTHDVASLAKKHPYLAAGSAALALSGGVKGLYNKGKAFKSLYSEGGKHAEYNSQTRNSLQSIGILMNEKEIAKFAELYYYSLLRILDTMTIQ